MITVRHDGSALEVVVHHEVLRIEPWGDDSLRVRVGQHDILDDLPGALVPPKPCPATITVDGGIGRISNGA
ncbi:MAG TPA: family 31 glucosidase, partial [Pseudonocardiaceae bacterium]